MGRWSQSKRRSRGSMPTAALGPPNLPDWEFAPGGATVLLTLNVSPPVAYWQGRSRINAGAWSNGVVADSGSDAFVSGSTVPGDTVTMQVRWGDNATPDPAWSDWSLDKAFEVA